ncbi:unnamed protein product [Clavelina lepadiformis]|uniref:Uncharacterized protein n=1 Tax=Clavelina lepadiformis TaxID=159417 RepID=A0ABP0GHC1_CLALP
MGKKKRKLGRAVQKKDVFQRLNFLYQASYTALSMKPANHELARYYAATMKALALRNVVRLSPQIKRTICKKCGIILVPGVTCKVRNRSGRERFTMVHCLDCGYSRRFFLDPNYSLWNDNEENIDQIVIVKP